MPEQPIDALSGNDFGRDAPNATAEMIELLLADDRCWQILLQKSAITMREDCLDLLTRLPTMPLLASGSAPTRDLAPLWLGKACIERWWRSSDQFCEAA
jgi:hypothetical protein